MSAAPTAAPPALVAVLRTDGHWQVVDTADTSTTSAPTTVPIDSGLGDALVQPNSGHRPAYSGDRGTWPQYLVMFGILAALAVMFLIARAQASRRRRTRSEPVADSSTNRPESSARR